MTTPKRVRFEKLNPGDRFRFTEDAVNEYVVSRNVRTRRAWPCPACQSYTDNAGVGPADSEPLLHVCARTWVFVTYREPVPSGEQAEQAGLL